MTDKPRYTTIPVWPLSALMDNLRAMPDSDLEAVHRAIELELRARGLIQPSGQ